MTVIAQTTELEAVNTMLASIGEAPVSQLNDDTVADASLAQTILLEISKEVQSKGWHFNTEEKYSVAADVNGYCVLPANTLRCDTVYPDTDKDLVVRGLRLYDRKEHTYVIGESVDTDLVVGLEFDELPEPARRYINVRAARIFVDRSDSDPDLHVFTSSDELDAWISLVQFESESADYNMLVDNFDTYSIVSRQTPILGN